jgi:outer membrane protein insertion porin family
MLRPIFAVVCLLALARSAGAQVDVQQCAQPDSIAVRGNSRVTESTIRSDAGVSRGMAIDMASVQRMIRNLYVTGQFETDVRVLCEVQENPHVATLVIAVHERPVVSDIRVTGTDAVSNRTVRDRIEILAGRAADPALVTKAITRIDSLYESRGYYLVDVVPETTVVAGNTVLTFHINEGRRLAVSDIQFVGNAHMPAGDIAAVMKTAPEGFWWWKRGEFDEDTYAGDLSERIPALYGRFGFLKMQVLRDSLIVDRVAGKATVEISIEEGPQYHVGNFEIVGNRHFSVEDLRRFYPFDSVDQSVGQRLSGLLHGATPAQGIFDRERWDAALEQVQDAYTNDGYIRAQLSPVVQPSVGLDSVPVVHLRWDIEEGPLAVVHRIDILGNDYTSEGCIRSVILMLPGSVFSKDRLLRSYQQIGNLGFFDMPMPEPDVQPYGDEGLWDVTFHVKEKKTGNINFGASVGQGAGVGGFIGLDQPNLFGKCRRGSLQWQFGQLVNDFTLSYSDPAFRKSTVSGTVDLYHTRSRYVVRDFGRQTRSGGSLRLGFPIMGSSYTRLFLSYGGEAVSYGSDPNSLLGTLVSQCDHCFRSTLGTTITRDTRVGLPFAFGGTQQTFDAQFNGGPLGGTAKFQRYRLEQRFYTPLGTLGGGAFNAEPKFVVFGASARAGMVFGNTGPFFPFQEFAMGGTQQGEALRGYDEFSITPGGYVGSGGPVQATRASFGRAFFTTTLELGLRLNSSFYFNSFFDAGNVWDTPREFSPARLFRGAGFGVGLVTPLGPLGLDLGYGFDRIDAAGRPAPGWKLHFKLGQMF